MWRCPGCRTRRVSLDSLARHKAKCNLTLCQCPAYHFIHRPGSGACYQNPIGELVDAKRKGVSLAELFVIADSLAENHAKKVNRFFLNL